MFLYQEIQEMGYKTPSWGTTHSLDATTWTIGENMKWIDVKDQTPDRNGLYLVSYHGVYLPSMLDIDTAIWSQKTKTWNLSSHKEGTVTHWIPLPEPPEKT